MHCAETLKYWDAGLKYLSIMFAKFCIALSLVCTVLMMDRFPNEKVLSSGQGSTVSELLQAGASHRN
jgi:hypothetical protein